MTKSKYWEDSKSLPQRTSVAWGNVWDPTTIIINKTTTIDHGIQLKVHATKKYSHGQPVGFALSADKKQRIYQHIDSSGASRSQKEAFGVLVFNPQSYDVPYKTVGEVPMDSWMVILNNAQIDENVLVLETTQKINEIAMQLSLNGNIQVIRNSFKLPGVLDVPGEIT